MTQNAQQETGRMNWSEYSKSTGKPIPANIGPGKSYKPSPQALKAQQTAKRLGRVNVSEYKAITEKPRRKAVPRKRVSGK